MSIKGISKDVKTTSGKLIKPTAKNPITLTTIEGIVMEKTPLKDDTKLVSFIGLEMPRLTIAFSAIPLSKDEDAPHYFETFFPLTLDTKPSEKALEVQHNKMFQKLKHLIETLKGKKSGAVDVITDAEYKLLDLYTKADAKKEETYTEILEKYNAAELLAEYERFFNNIIDIFEGGKESKTNPKPQPIYKTPTTPKGIWLKLIFKKEAKRFQTPDFVGNGCYELFVQGRPTTLAINVSRGESIEEVAFNKNAPADGSLPHQNNQPVNQDTIADLPDFMKVQ